MHIRASELCRSDMIAYQCLGCSAASECQPMWVDILPPLYLYKSSGKVVLERSELGKSCLRKLHCLRKIFYSLPQNLPLFRFFHERCNLFSRAFMAPLPSRKLDDILKDKRKIVVRQAEVHLSHTVWVAREETHVEKGWRTPARRALLQR